MHLPEFTIVSAFFIHFAHGCQTRRLRDPFEDEEKWRREAGVEVSVFRPGHEVIIHPVVNGTFSESPLACIGRRKNPNVGFLASQVVGAAYETESTNGTRCVIHAQNGNNGPYREGDTLGYFSAEIFLDDGEAWEVHYDVDKKKFFRTSMKQAVRELVGSNPIFSSFADRRMRINRSPLHSVIPSTIGDMGATKGGRSRAPRNCFEGIDDDQVQVLTITFAVDDGAYAKLGRSDWEVTSKVDGMLASVNIVYREQLRIEFERVDILFRDKFEPNTNLTFPPKPQYHGRCQDGYSIHYRLGLFTQWRQDTYPTTSGLWHLITDCHPAYVNIDAGAPVGLGWVGDGERGVCNPFGCGTSSLQGSYGVQTWISIAHEIGHNFGVHHSKNGGLMNVGDHSHKGRVQFMEKDFDNLCDGIRKSRRTSTVELCWKTFDSKIEKKGQYHRELGHIATATGCRDVPMPSCEQCAKYYDSRVGDFGTCVYEMDWKICVADRTAHDIRMFQLAPTTCSQYHCTENVPIMKPCYCNTTFCDKYDKCVNGACIPPKYGCTDHNPKYYNRNPQATKDDGSCASCSDDKMNGRETGVDFGGDCSHNESGSFLMRHGLSCTEGCEEINMDVDLDAMRSLTLQRCMTRVASLLGEVIGHWTLSSESGQEFGCYLKKWDSDFPNRVVILHELGASGTTADAKHRENSRLCDCRRRQNSGTDTAIKIDPETGSPTLIIESTTTTTPGPPSVPECAEPDDCDSGGICYGGICIAQYPMSEVCDELCSRIKGYQEPGIYPHAEQLHPTFVPHFLGTSSSNNQSCDYYPSFCTAYPCSSCRVSCGESFAASCAQCTPPSEEYCKEDCMWENDHCVERPESGDLYVSCGAYQARSCGTCKSGVEEDVEGNTCGGDCEWIHEQNLCVQKELRPRVAMTLRPTNGSPLTGSEKICQCPTFGKSECIAAFNQCNCYWTANECVSGYNAVVCNNSPPIPHCDGKCVEGTNKCLSCTKGYVVSADGLRCLESRDALCPLTYPYAFLNGDWCCKTNEENTIGQFDGKQCNGSSISWYSRCCNNDAAVACPHKGRQCINADGEKIVGPVKLQIIIHAGLDLPDKDDGVNYSDPYIILKSSTGRTLRSPTKWGPNPEWNWSHSFEFETKLILQVIVWDYDDVGASDHMSQAELKFDAQLRSNWRRNIQLYAQDNVTKAGELDITAAWMVPRSNF